MESAYGYGSRSAVVELIDLLGGQLDNIWRTKRKIMGLINCDLRNRAKFGKFAPKYADKLLIDPNQVNYFSRAGFKRCDSGLVVSGDWDLKIEPLKNNKKIEIVYARISSGASWYDVGAVENMLRIIKYSPGEDGCYSEADVMLRYKKLDELIENLRAGGICQ